MCALTHELEVSWTVLLMRACLILSSTSERGQGTLREIQGGADGRPGVGEDGKHVGRRLGGLQVSGRWRGALRLGQ